MGLSGALLRLAASQAHVLVAEAPGAFRERVGLERALDRRGWRIAASVADADVLAVVGEPNGALAGVVEHAWSQMSEPRVRLRLHDLSRVDEALAEAEESLRLGGDDRERPVVRPGFTPSAPESHGDHADHDGGDQGHEGGGHDGGGHGGDGHDHGAMKPDGVPLAEGAEDRDGLEMDQLHLPLGPLLAHWPAGVVLRLTLRGDVVADAEVERLMGGVGGEPADRNIRAARLLDAAASVLMLAGVPADAARARQLRDRFIDGTPVDGTELDALTTRVRRNRVLRWMLGHGVGGDDDREQELLAQLTGLIGRAQESVGGEEGPSSGGGPSMQAVPELLRGQEVAMVRLWMAVWSADLTDSVPEVGSRG